MNHKGEIKVYAQVKGVDEVEHMTEELSELIKKARSFANDLAVWIYPKICVNRNKAA